MVRAREFVGTDRRDGWWSTGDRLPRPTIDRSIDGSMDRSSARRVLRDETTLVADRALISHERRRRVVGRRSEGGGKRPSFFLNERSTRMIRFSSSLARGFPRSRTDDKNPSLTESSADCVRQHGRHHGRHAFRSHAEREEELQRRVFLRHGGPSEHEEHRFPGPGGLHRRRRPRRRFLRHHHLRG